MQSFVVLGIIPGTNIQTNLNFWITVAILLAVLSFRRRLIPARNVLRMSLAACRIAYTIRNYEFETAY